MTAINVIDLDKTLIPYDSFRRIVLYYIKKKKLRITWLTFLRVCRFVNQERFKREATICIKSYIDDQEVSKFVRKLYLDIDQDVLECIKASETNTSINVLLSASPDFYVSGLIKDLNWVGKGSFFNAEGKFIHLYGKNKINWLKVNYPESQYDYNFAISDSSTDDDLLNMFKKKIKWTLP